jgi:hypothetical protein
MKKHLFVIIIILLIESVVSAQSVNNSYRFDATIIHPIAKNLTGYSGIGLVSSSDKNQNEYYISFPGITYAPKKWLQFWGGFKDFFTNNWETENTNELRPYGGIKILIPNTAKVHLYNFTQYEYRHITKITSETVQQYGRIRNRFGMEVPLNKNPWTPKTFYMLADAEPFYRFDKNIVDQIRLRMGPGYVINGHFRLEFIWRMQLMRSTSDNPFSYTDNTFRINLKISTKEGLFEKLLHPDFEMD